MFAEYWDTSALGETLPTKLPPMNHIELAKKSLRKKIALLDMLTLFFGNSVQKKAAMKILKAPKFVPKINHSAKNAWQKNIAVMCNHFPS